MRLGEGVSNAVCIPLTSWERYRRGKARGGGEGWGGKQEKEEGRREGEVRTVG